MMMMMMLPGQGAKGLGPLEGCNHGFQSRSGH
jgi:hypothetical protein